MAERAGRGGWGDNQTTVIWYFEDMRCGGTLKACAVGGEWVGRALCSKRLKPPVRMEFQKRTWLTNPPPPLRTARVGRCQCLRTPQCVGKGAGECSRMDHE